MAYIRIIWKVFLFILITSTFLLFSMAVRLLFRDLKKRRVLYTSSVSFCTRLMLFFMNARIKVTNAPAKDKTHLIVSNHLGMMDILIISSLRPCLFITSVDMRETPGLGFLTEAGGSLYVERRNRSNITNEISEIREALTQGFNVVLFPEATSTDGEKVLPFKKTLMTSAAGTGVPIMPVCINYRKVNDEKMSDKWRDHIFWYGDIPFITAFSRHFALLSVDIEVDFMQEIICHNEEERRQVAQMAQDQIVAKYTPIPRPEAPAL